MNSPIIIGLDTEKIPVRLIYAVPDTEQEHAVPYVVESRSFKSAGGFRRYWGLCCARTPNLLVAVSDRGKDPLGLIDWLKNQQARLEAYPWMCYQGHLNGDFEIWGLQKQFERPFALALYASYRLQSLSVAHQLWTKISVAQGMLTEIRHGLHRLSAALPECCYSDANLECEQLDAPF